MKLRTLALVAINGIFCVAVLAAGASGEPAAPSAPAAPALSTPAAPTATQTPQPVVAVDKAPKADDVAIRLNAPLFSPLFAKTPLAMVNEEPITIEDLKKTLGTIHEGMVEGKAVPKKNFPELLKRLVNSMLIIQEARNMELDKLDEIKTSVDDYSKKLRREMLLKAEVKDVKADEKEVNKAYQERTTEWRLKSLIIDKLDDVNTLQADLKAGKKFDDLYERAIKEGRAKEGGKTDDFLSRDVIAPSMLVTLEKMKIGETSKPLALEKGYLIYRLEEKRTKENPEVKEQIRQDMDTKARVKALEAFQESLIKKYTTRKKLFDTLDFENKKVKFETFLKDKRVICEVKGEKPVTVADLAEAIATKFYHGVERAAEGKKINKEKKAVLDEYLGTILFDKEAKARKLDQSEEYRNKVKSYSNSLLFGMFVTKIIRSEITVTKDDLLDYYNAHAKEYTTLDAYKLDAIAFETSQKAEEAVDKLRKGMDFKWLKANADGRVSISKALISNFEGEAIPKPNLPEVLQKALTGATTGDYRVLVDGKQGYAVMVVLHEPSRVMTYPEVEDAIKEAVFYEKLNKGVESWADKLRSSSDVTIYADFAQ
jgi:parvulin-like peptidyl-prolyl isomerase